MKRATLLILFLAAVVGFATAAPRGGQAADFLYANSIYGLTHPLPSHGMTPYALSPDEVRSRQRNDGAIGALGNMLLPGLGSALIGDGAGIWGAIGYWTSVSVALGAVTLAALVTFESPTPPDLSAYYLTAGISLGAASVFYVWDIFAPIRYVRRKQYTE